MCAASAQAIESIPRYYPFDFCKQKADLQHAYPYLQKGVPLTEKTIEVAKQLISQITTDLTALASALIGLEGDERKSKIREFKHLEETSVAYCLFVERIEVFVADLKKATQLFDPASLRKEDIELLSRLSKGCGKQVAQLIEQSIVQFHEISMNYNKFQTILLPLQEAREHKRDEISLIYDFETGNGSDWEVLDP